MANKPNILKKIIKNKIEEITERRKNITLRQIIDLAEIASPAFGFVNAIETKINSGYSAVIAEIKKASPSKGLLRKGFIFAPRRRDCKLETFSEDQSKEIPILLFYILIIIFSFFLIF